MSNMRFVLALAAPAAAATTQYSGPGRTGANVALLFALVGVVVGVLAIRSVGRFGGRAGAMTALAFGLTGAILAVVHLARTVDGFGTGNGRAGAIIALVLAQIGVNLGGIVLARVRRRSTVESKRKGAAAGDQPCGGTVCPVRSARKRWPGSRRG